ncbi:MAG: hypothetical protein K2K29_03725 [Muribaculaceae bacterium]|nr:hypothetical protein [Muribaculaceae bacterium]
MRIKRTYEEINPVRLMLSMILISIFGLQSCKSDEEEIFLNYWEFPKEINVAFNEKFSVLKLNTSENDLVLPSAAMAFETKVDNTSVVRQMNNNSFQAVDMGSTNILIYSESGKLMATVEVTVTSPFNGTVPDRMEVKYYEKTNIFENYDEWDITPKYNFESSDPEIVEINSRGEMRGHKVGTAIIAIRSLNTNTVLKRIEVSVIPNETYNMTSGETRKVSLNYHSSTNEEVAVVTNSGILQAKMPGSTYIYGNYGSTPLCWQVNVSEGTLKSLFTLTMPDSRYPDIDEIKACMGNRPYIYNESVYYSNQEYEALIYAPFDEAESITFYFSKLYYSYGELQFAIIKTGKPSVEVAGYMRISNLNPTDGQV